MASMSARDRKLVLAIIPIVVIVAYWFLLLAPKREEASTAVRFADEAGGAPRHGQGRARQASGAKTDFRGDYTEIVRLGKAIPADVDMPSLIVQLEGAAEGTDIRSRRSRPASAPR